ncbi:MULTISPECIES: class I SAM-dependent methyltransferase [unclassified Psychrobacter]|uniref:class I SAM-dependent methyltransferase n=1 Tax=unclassified Psychrobacter TaxID=196806 RepID=UPI00046F2CC6|nr:MULTISPECIES: class I SAM-dependent methyltransferase [unclassified Psychrobacter]
MIKLLYVDHSQLAAVERLQTLIADNQLPITLAVERIKGKIKQRLAALNAEGEQAALLLDNKNKLSLLKDGLSVAPEWDKLQRRVVSAGRKSELILRAAKISADSQVIDATAGFGHDSLILASTGAQVTMLEQEPLMALLLFSEQQRMSAQPNWQKLMARLTIINTDALSYFAQLQKNTTDQAVAVNVVYLDPMFPEDSYQDSKTGKGAKVGKQMQALHHLAHPPTLDEEMALLNKAQAVVADNQEGRGRVIVKRPQQAPFLSQQNPDESWHNAAVRFDGYFV